ncbi:hypothetical protein [Providencia phage PSTCR7]|uniref:Uncharacterized protein n=1 Tax=Providencia phage PSTCR7 TaxID=2783549 RepID=A0A7S9SWJ7_9CAUD|nr:hypothetical protein PQD10_gp25 [Providencia phage PSTCR7]QPI18477.1 hypothetical protein [Providencia phage PSTCR7]
MNIALTVTLRTLIQFPFVKKPEQSYAFTVRKIKDVTTLCDSLGLTKSQLIIRMKRLADLGIIECDNVNDIVNRNMVTYKIIRNKETMQFIK